MGNGITVSDSPYNVTHFNPYYNLQYGWCDADILRSDGSYRLYASSTGQYRPLLIPTDDPKQYFLIEARDGEGFDSEILITPEADCLRGVTVWRIDQTTMNTLYSQAGTRRGISMEGVATVPGTQFKLEYYKDFSNVSNVDLISAGITVTITDDPYDGSFVIDVRHEP